MKKIFDLLVVGDDLAALVAATAAHHAGAEVAVLGASDARGLTPQFLEESNFIPQDARWRDTLSSLATWPALAPMEVSEAESSPFCMESSKILPLLGFGENKFHSMDFLSLFTPALRLNLQPHLGDLRLRLLSNLQCKKWGTSGLSKIERADSMSELTLNSGETLAAKNLFFTTDPTKWHHLLPEGFRTPKADQKLAKMECWSLVALHLSHPEGFEPPRELQKGEMFFIWGGGREFEPLLGRFFEGPGEIWRSLWGSPLPAESLEDSEQGARLVHHMKRGLCRGFGEGVRLEKISVQENAFGHFEPTGFSDRNFWLLGDGVIAVSSLFCLQPSGLAATHQALSALSHLGLPIESVGKLSACFESNPIAETGASC